MPLSKLPLTMEDLDTTDSCAHVSLHPNQLGCFCTTHGCVRHTLTYAGCIYAWNAGGVAKTNYINHSEAENETEYNASCRCLQKMTNCHCSEDLLVHW